jgi:DMSO/TMAO reductase YedYZ molybdopterin-dependent catalytic subunit
MRRLSRRQLLFAAAMTAAGLLAGSVPRAPRSSRPASRAMWITPNEKFYQQQYYFSVPKVNISKWQLVIDGLVKKPLTLKPDALESFKPAEAMRTLECLGNRVGGEQIGNAVWQGFWFKELLDQVGVDPRATRAHFEAVDGYTTALDVAWLTQPGVLMATGMNGEPLPLAHGYPVRLVVPGLHGQKMTKWITRIEFIDHDYKGFWESLGWSDIAEAKTHSMIFTPLAGDWIRLPFEMSGMAWAGRRRIARVEVGIDQDWREAELVRGESTLTWTQWYFTLDSIQPGRHTLRVRATDEVGFTQHAPSDWLDNISVYPFSSISSYPDGTDQIHSIQVDVRA